MFYNGLSDLELKGNDFVLSKVGYSFVGWFDDDANEIKNNQVLVINSAFNSIY